jgi:hypothetical protein
MNKWVFSVEESHVGLRADVFVAQLLTETTRSQIKKLFDLNCGIKKN